MITLKFFGLVIIFVALMNVILALVNDENGMFTDDYNPYEDEYRDFIFNAEFWNDPTDELFDYESVWLNQHEEYWYEYEEKELY